MHHISHIKWPATGLKALLPWIGMYLSGVWYSLTIFVSIHLLDKVIIFDLKGSHNAILNSFEFASSQIPDTSYTIYHYHCCDNLKTRNIISLFLLACYDVYFQGHTTKKKLFKRNLLWFVIFLEPFILSRSEDLTQYRTCYGLKDSGIESWWELNFPHFQNSPGAHSAPLYEGAGSLSCR